MPWGVMGVCGVHVGALGAGRMHGLDRIGLWQDSR
jgi:hypothetical protein